VRPDRARCCRAGYARPAWREPCMGLAACSGDGRSSSLAPEADTVAAERAGTETSGNGAPSTEAPFSIDTLGAETPIARGVSPSRAQSVRGTAGNATPARDDASQPSAASDAGLVPADTSAPVDHEQHAARGPAHRAAAHRPARDDRSERTELAAARGSKVSQLLSSNDTPSGIAATLADWNRGARAKEHGNAERHCQQPRCTGG
jgi:hypothetical protein